MMPLVEDSSHIYPAEKKSSVDFLPPVWRNWQMFEGWRQ